MTAQFYHHPLVDLHYYQFGAGPKHLLCFHGLGMHGKQFTVLEKQLGDTYTFYGFDLFFHKQTKLKNQDLAAVKAGITPQAYSLGTYYSAVLLKEMPEKIEEAFFIAPSFLKTPRIIQFLALNPIGNYLFQKLVLSEAGLHRLLKLVYNLKVIDQEAYEILYKEIETPQLRFDFYANMTYLRKLSIKLPQLITTLNEHKVNNYFIFGERDHAVPPHLAKLILPHLTQAKFKILDEGHDLITSRLSKDDLYCI
jgi:pimeloyl-ACP methyl ester carboxylesterase